MPASIGGVTAGRRQIRNFPCALHFTIQDAVFGFSRYISHKTVIPTGAESTLGQTGLCP